MPKSNKPRLKEKSQKKPSDKCYLLYNKAQRLISYRPRSESELRLRLTQYVGKWKLEHSLVEEVLQILKEENVIDDFKFAQWWIEQRSDFNPRGKRMITAELKAKGVDEEIIREAIALLHTGEIDIFGVKREALDEKTLALGAAMKKQKMYKTEDKFTFEKKMVRYLVSRGFDYTTSSDVTQELIIKNYE